MYVGSQSVMKVKGNSIVTFNRTTSDNTIGMVVMYIGNHSTIIFEEDSTVYFNGNYGATYFGIMLIDLSTVLFKGNSTVSFYRNECKGNVASLMSIYSSSNITFKENSTVNFIENRASGSGAVMSIFGSSTITFEGNSTVHFFNNGAGGNGGVINIHYSTITFKGSSTVNFDNNHAHNHGGVMYISNSTITFAENSTVNFTDYDNDVNSGGGVMYVYFYSTIRFQGNSTINFIDNIAVNNNGGVMDIHYYCIIRFEGNSVVNFIGNHANGNGGVMYIYQSSIKFEGNSYVTFINNDANGNGGVLYVSLYSTVTFKEKSTVSFIDNGSNGNGGVMYIVDKSIITFQGNSLVNFTGSHANSSTGVMYIYHYSNVTFGKYTTVSFINNHANIYSGVMYIERYSAITFQGHATLTFIDNHAVTNGGVMYIKSNSIIKFQGNSAVTFHHNQVDINGGVMYITDHSNVIFDREPTVKFIDNHANNGGVVYIQNYSAITFEGNCKVNFIDNHAIGDGGLMYIQNYSTIIFRGNSITQLIDSKADINGGVMYIEDYSNITFQGNSTSTFHHNHAKSNGGVIYTNQYSSLLIEEMPRVFFSGNTAYLGGSIYMNSSSFIIDGSSSVTFSNNTALQDGGAIYLRDRSIFELLENSKAIFYYNSALDYGGAVYVLYDKWTSIGFHNHSYFIGNTTGTTQSSVYINVDKSCDRDCFLISSTNKDDKPITTSPYGLVIHNPAKCINGNKTDCDTYYMNYIMLGQDITFDACLLDYYDQPTEAAQFTITGMSHQDYHISSSKYITISCNRTTQGITVTGNLQTNKTYNYSIYISLHVSRISESKIVSVNLIVELSQCHPGFWYSPANESQKCECYNTGDIISCSGSNSTIKRGYWYGRVTGTPTVTTCPNDYCNFTCCEITNGIYHLSPVRANQCRPYRSGTACGSCEEGYTLSFDSPECVETNRCTVGVVLVTTLSLLYWIAVAIAVFVMMYFKVSFGSLYAIVYYYSVVDILLSRVLFISNGLYTTVAIMSSLAKLTPQFLGQLCLVRNMSGIDQQFIHYVHPVVVFLILVMISRLAKRSRKVSSFVSKGIISFICFLLLLSYTSVASTSLLLMRSLRFMDIDKVYTYLSPDIEYFNGRHLAYAIVALILTVTIVIGFPLLLLLEPFLNSKINFFRIKPLLDQFQGCYKDKYRYFAGYYMICRLVIILLVIVKISDDFTTQYLLISSCALMQLIHLLVRPYASTINNIFDGIILQLIVIISVLPVIEVVDQYNETFVIVIIYFLVILPLISFIAIKVWINKNIIQIALCKYKNIFIACYHNKKAADNPQKPVEMKEFDVIVDENVRKNAIIVDV